MLFLSTFFVFKILFSNELSLFSIDSFVFPGCGSSLKFGGKTKGFFFSTKNSSPVFPFLSLNPSVTDPQLDKKLKKKSKPI